MIQPKTMDQPPTGNATGIQYAALSALFTSLQWMIGQLPLVLSIVTGVASLAAVIYSVLVSRATLRLRRFENAEHKLLMCRECEAGNPPAICPLPLEDRPADCRLNLIQSNHHGRR